ncbi:hypothetical protein H0H92_011735, partial [Tricholoma furcatifolium]
MKIKPLSDDVLPAAFECSREFDFAPLLAAAVEEEYRRHVVCSESSEEELRSFEAQNMHKNIPSKVDPQVVSAPLLALRDSVSSEGLGNFEVRTTQESNVDIAQSAEQGLLVNSNGKRPRKDAWKVRKKAKLKARAACDVYDMGGLPTARSIHLTPTATHLPQNMFDMEAVKVAGPGYVGPRKTLTKTSWTVDELKAAGFEFMEWPE